MAGHVSSIDKAPSLLKPRAQQEAGAHIAANPMDKPIDFNQKERPVDLSGVSLFGAKC